MHLVNRFLGMLSALCILVVSASYAEAEKETSRREGKPVFWMIDTYEAQADFKADGYTGDSEGDPSVTVNQIQAGASYPLYLGESFRLMSGAELSGYQFMFSSVELNDINTYDISIPFNAMYTVNEKWMLMAILSPGIHSDLEKVNHNDFKTSFLLLANYSYSDQLKLSAGAAYSRIFGDDEYFPAAGLTWTPNDTWAVRLIFPRPGIEYTVSDRLRFSLGAGPAGGKWNIEDPRKDRNNGKEYTFEFDGWRLGAGVEYDLSDRWSITADVGTTLRRSYCIENDDETLLDSDVDDTFGVRIGLLFYR